MIRRVLHNELRRNQERVVLCRSEVIIENTLDRFFGQRRRPIQRLSTMKPSVEIDQATQRQEPLADARCHFLQSSILVDASNVAFNMHMRRPMLLVLGPSPKCRHATEDPTAWPHVGTKKILAAV